MTADAQPYTEARCRVCASALHDVLDLGQFALSDFVRDQTEQVVVPLTLAQCEACELVQLRHTVARDQLYRMYWYVSGMNPSMIESLRDIVRNVQARVELVPGEDVVIDVGANDGTLLSLYTERVQRIGFDPALNLAELARKNCDIFVNDYFETSELELPKAKVLTSIAMFYDLDNPRAFVERVRSVLHPQGLWVVQMTDLVRMLRANAFDNVCHEHLCYYSLAQLRALVSEYDLEIVDVEFNDVNGASVRAYVAHRGQRTVEPSVQHALDDEASYLADDAIEHFASRVRAARASVLAFIEIERAKGKKFHALGASTKGNTLLQYFGLGPAQIECAAEVNAEKFGLYTAGTRIPIVSESVSLAQKPDYYLVLPWHFIQFFVRVRADYLAAGGALLVPLPEPTVYDAESVWPLHETDVALAR